LSNLMSPPGGPASAQEQRKRLLVWLSVGLILPGVLLLALKFALGTHSSGFTVQSELPGKAIPAFFVALATWMVARMERRPLDDYGIPLRQAFGARFWEGCVWGFGMLTLMLWVLRESGHFRIDSFDLTGRALIVHALGWGAAFLAVSISEEFTFRGYLLFSLAKRLRFWPAAIFISVLFGAAHVPNHGETALGIVQVVGTGLLFCLMIRRTGNLWFALGYHAMWDWAQTFFFGTPDSGLVGVGRYLNSSVQGPDWLTGGSAGPEGSVLALLVLLLCALLIHVRFPKAIYPDRPV
jgi:membrane protease YdiL (CAAX protease family)